jgi:hypothetical protein
LHRLDDRLDRLLYRPRHRLGGFRNRSLVRWGDCRLLGRCGRTCITTTQEFIRPLCPSLSASEKNDQNNDDRTDQRYITPVPQIRIVLCGDINVVTKKQRLTPVTLGRLPRNGSSILAVR